MSFLSILSSIGLYLWALLKLWLHAIFVAPFENLNMLWVLVPIYLGWLFTEVFQEKKGTSIGNAISNGVIALWVGIDWTRTTTNALIEGTKMTWKQIAGKFLVAVFVLLYGIFIIYKGAKGKALTKYIGRIRIVTYIVIVFTPIFYNVVELTWQFVFSVVLFFPLGYFVIEMIDRIIPDPESLKEGPNAF
ncbi:hypothetical protein J4458_00790 [Candidatus Woesearchaeota archaeon]|nr:hypothetical protein [Candidatus Woesearchaeota archaeon]